MSRQLIDFRYEIQRQLGSGGMGEVYQAYDWVNREVVALKKVKIPLPSPDEETLKPDDDSFSMERYMRTALTNEFKVLAGMRHPYIISVLDYGFIKNDNGIPNVPYFTMEYLENPVTILDYAQQFDDYRQKVNLLVRTLEALRYLHWQQILHRDLKPENIMLADDKIKVLDFGIAILKHYDQEAETGGTLLYMSPEALVSDPLTDASDLWSFGIIAFEIFTNKRPFSQVHEILMHDPDWARITQSDLLMIMQKLLSKEVDKRFPDADSVIKALAPLADITVNPHLESYIDSIPFSGRSQELMVLRGDLEATRAQKGRIRLIIGESGIGKSRLVDELRIHALVDNVMVLRGQAMSEESSPYHIWRMIIRRLCLMAPMTDLQASILKTIVTDIADLLGRDQIESAPPLPQAGDMSDGDAAQRRLFDTISEIVKQAPRPLLILLEDLHWADDASIDLLEHLIPSLEDHHVMILGTYCPQDDTKDLKAKFAKVPAIELQRLQEDDIEQLAKKTFDTTEIDTELLDLMQQESNGNIFLLVEVIRELAEQIGNLTLIGKIRLPDHVFSKGLESIIQRRLRRLKEEDIQLLNLAAIAGYEIDTSLLADLHPEMNIEQWLTICAASTLLEVDEGRWRFSHNRLRQGILNTIVDTRPLHRRVAEYKEKTYSNQSGQHVSIAIHWEFAGELEKSGRWYVKAAENAEELYASSVALEFYQKALDFLPDRDVLGKLMIRENLARLFLWRTRFQEAWDVLVPAQELADTLQDKVALARIFIRLSDIKQESGEGAEALSFIERAVEHATEAGEAGRELLIEALNNQVVSHMRLGDLAIAREIAEKALKLAQEWKIQSKLAIIMSKIGELSIYGDDFPNAVRYMQEALDTARALEDERQISVMLSNLGEVYRMGDQFDQALDYFNQALQIHKKLGALDGELIGLTNIAMVYLSTKEFKPCETNLMLVLETLNGRDWWGLPAVYPTLVEAQFEQQKLEEAKSSAQEWLVWANIKNDEGGMTMAQGWLERL